MGLDWVGFIQFLGFASLEAQANTDVAITQVFSQEKFLK
jgi:hypothetical protein